VLDYLLQYGLFLAEVTTVVIAIGVVIGFLFNAIRHARESAAEHLEVKNLNRRFEQMAGHCHGDSGLRPRWRFGSHGDEKNQLQRVPVST
jgi:hypothetical protein